MQSTKNTKFKKRIAAVGTAVASFAMAASLMFSACAVPLNNSDDKTFNKTLTAEEVSSTEQQQDTTSLRFVVGENFADAWNNAVSNSKTLGKQVYFILDADWLAPTDDASHPFGTGDGFSYGRICIPDGADIVLDLNGHTINRQLNDYTQLGSNLYVGGGKLTLEDSAGGGNITGGYTAEKDNWHSEKPEEDYGGGIMMNGGELTINGGNITGNKGDCAAGVYVLDGKFVMNGGSVTNNIADRNGGGVEIEGTSEIHEINGGLISGNYANGTGSTNGGGGVRLDKNVSLIITGGTITDNHSANNGGGVFMSEKSELTVTGGEISYNDAASYEGGICLMDNTKIILNGGVITQNTQATGCALNPGASSSVSIGGPVKIYDNFTNGDQANLRVTTKLLTITGDLTTEKGSAYIGITTGIGNNGKLTTGATGKTNGYTYTSYTAAFVFSDDPSKRIAQGGAEWQILTSNSKTAILDATWQYKLDTSTDWETVESGGDLTLTYGSELVAVRTIANADGATLFDWQSGGATTSTAYAAFNNSTTAFTSVSNAGYYSFLPNLSTVPSSYKPTVSASVTCAIGLPPFTVNIQPREITVNLKDATSEYGCALAALEAEVNPSTPLASADASMPVTSLVTPSTDATNTSDLGSYTVKGKVQPTVNNYKITINTAAYTISQATITATISGSKTYNGQAQNNATVKFNYPAGFAGTKLDTTAGTDYTVTYPTDLINADEYDKDDIKVTLKSTETASRFKWADTDDSVTGSYEIKKAKLTVTAKDESIGYGEAEPEHEVTYSGFVNGETEGVLTGTLAFTCKNSGGTIYSTTSPAGTYKITPSGYESDNYDIEFKDGTLTVGKGSANVPTVDKKEYTYDGDSHTFTLTYTSDAVKSVTLSDTTNFTLSEDQKSVTATNAGKCKITFVLNSDKYTWNDETKSVSNKTIDIEIKQKSLEFTFTASGDTNWKWDFDPASTGTLSYAESTTAGPVSGETPAYIFTYTKTGGSPVPVSGTSIDIKDLASGNYTAKVELIAKGENGYSAVNDNYTVNTDKNSQQFKIDAGGADTSGLVWSIVKGDDPATALFNDDGSQVEIKYALKDGAANVYTIPAPQIPTEYNYMQPDTDTRDGFTNGIKITNSKGQVVTDLSTPDTYTVCYALKTDGDHLFDDDEKYGGDSQKGTATITVTIKNGTVDTSKIKWQYKVGASGTPVDMGAPNTTDYPFTDSEGNAIPVYEVDYADGTMIFVLVKDGTMPDGTEIDELDGNSSKEITAEGNRVITTLSFTLTDTNFDQPDPVVLSWVITPKTVKIVNMPKGDLSKDGKKYKTPVAKADDDKLDLNEILDYVYTYNGTEYKGVDGLVELYELADDAGGQIQVKVNVVLKDGMDSKYKLEGTTEVASFSIGDNRTRAKATLEESSLVYSEVDFAVKVVEKDGGAQVSASGNYEVYIHDCEDVDKISNLTELGKLGEYKLSDLNAGKYVVEIRMTEDGDVSYSLDTYSFLIEVTQKEIDVPEIIKKIEFKGEQIKFEEYLDGKYQQYLDGEIIKAVSYPINAINVGPYTATLEIINANYKWKQPAESGGVTTKAVVKFSLADDAVSQSVTVDGAVASYNWKIAPYKLGTDILDLSGKNGAKINASKLPEWARTLITDGSLKIGVAYYADEAATTPLSDEEVVFKGGRSYYVSAVLGAGENGDDSNNFTFANDDTVKLSSAAVTYTVPESGAAALMNNVKEFASKTMLGLPMWAWLLIALAVLILLIIIIAVCVKRRKTKEQREEAKARREEERRMQQERLEAERELARARQEAELEKIRAQAGMAGAGMASMAMQQQAMPTPAQQAPVQQADNSAMQRLEAELAEMRAKLAAVQAMPSQPAQSLQPYSHGGQSVSADSLGEIKMQLALIRAEQQANKELSAMKTELEMARLASHGYNYGQRPQNTPLGDGMNAELLGDALIAAFAKLMSQKGMATEQPAVNTVEENVSQPVLAQYPSDAVITTTTTVDTTQKPVRRERDGAREERNDFSDVDGFYDNIDY